MVLVGLRLLDAPWFPANGSALVLPLVMVVNFVGAMLAPPIFGSLNAMFADIVDEHELETGHRREGVIFAARSFLIKAISSVGVVVGGWVIDWIDFPRGARAGTVPEDVLWDLGLYQAPLPSIFVFLAVILYSGYRLDRKRHAEILAALNQRRAAARRQSTFRWRRKRGARERSEQLCDVENRSRRLTDAREQQRAFHRCDQQLRACRCVALRHTGSCSSTPVMMRIHSSIARTPAAVIDGDCGAVSSIVVAIGHPSGSCDSSHPARHHSAVPPTNALGCACFAASSVSISATSPPAMSTAASPSDSLPFGK